MSYQSILRHQKVVIFDRDGVLNEERGVHTYRPQDFLLRANVPDALRLLKAAGYYLAVVTNQSGISRGMYSRADMEACHKVLHEATDYVLDAIYYSPYHPSVSESLGRKPGSLLLERVLGRFGADPERSWMLGDKDRDLVPAHRLGMQAIMMGEGKTEVPLSLRTDDILEAAQHIVTLS